MAVTSTIKAVKLGIKYDKGSQTISGINEGADIADLYTAGIALGDLCQYSVEQVKKIVETDIVGA